MVAADAWRDPTDPEDRGSRVGDRESARIWIEQCEAARRIREVYGVDKALGYLIGEKVLTFLEAADRDPVFAAELPEFVKEVRRIFQPEEIRRYLDTVERVGPLGHVTTAEEYEGLREASVVADDPVDWAENILLLERLKVLLVP